ARPIQYGRSQSRQWFLRERCRRFRVSSPLRSARWPIANRTGLCRAHHDRLTAFFGYRILDAVNKFGEVVVLPVLLVVRRSPGREAHLFLAEHRTDQIIVSPMLGGMPYPFQGDNNRDSESEYRRINGIDTWNVDQHRHGCRADGSRARQNSICTAVPTCLLHVLIDLELDAVLDVVVRTSREFRYDVLLLAVRPGCHLLDHSNLRIVDERPRTHQHANTALPLPRQRFSSDHAPQGRARPPQ